MRWLLLAAVLLGGCVWPENPATPTPLATSPTSVPARPRAKWTLIFYFAADNDLEESEMDDLEELTQLPLSQDVRILALVDRSPLGEPSEGYSNRAVANLANWSNAKLLEVGPDKLTELDDWGQLNMADPQSLRRLMQVAQERYPAQQYGLFLVDHGQAWSGLCSDESTSRDNDTLDLKELQTALEAQPSPLELLVLDACMMSTLEVYLAAAPHARYMVASQDSLPAQGLDYVGALGRLQEKPGSDGQQLGKWFLESYRQSLKSDPEELSRVQLSLLRSEPQLALRHAFEKLAQQLRPQLRKHWRSVAKARASAQSFHSEQGQGAEVHDLGQLLTQLSERLPRLAAAVAQLRQPLKAAVVDQVRGRYRQGCSGLSVFFPLLAEHLSSEYFASVEPLAGEWVHFLQDYTRMERTLVARPPLSEVALVGGQRVELQARLGAEVAASYTILVQDHCVVGQMTCVPDHGSTLLNDYFDGHWLSLGEKDGGPSILAHLQAVELESTSAPTALATLPCQLKRKDSNTGLDVQLFFALHPDDLQRPASLLGVSRSSGLGAVELRLQAGDQISFLQRDLSPGGHSRPGPALRLVHPDRLSLQLAPVPPGDYRLGFLVIDLQGRTHWQTKKLMWGE
ncbi:hypothetical protein IV102_01085 [bacterium]|nr:hypothetical protein [bacterium]